MNPKSPVEKRSRAAEEIVAAVENDIVSGVLVPGQRIDEVALAGTFGVSRTPVREAVLELATRGIVRRTQAWRTAAH